MREECWKGWDIGWHASVGAGEAGREGCKMASMHWEAGRACYEHIRT
jgi:hypothetical protein